ncbi:TetR/AcrR family transcriptional regulator [Dactylosporangium sp. CA-233914]|uniref:TetR/AcrR family transcriptional regulator n=1 Tax=Dactylosporangium sp. CA-233914 TaxID=3239934 RepID=UPI003D8EE704
MRRSGGTSKGDILRTFAASVARVGYDEASFREVAEELGISKGTIVHHYGTKERLFEAVQRAYMERRLWEAEQILAAGGGAEAQLTGIIAQLLVAQQDDRDATLAFAREITRFGSMDVMRDVREMRARYAAMLEGVLRDGMNEGVFVEHDPALVAFQVFGMCNWVWTWWRPGHRWSIADVVRTWMTTLLSGLEVHPGNHGLDVDAIVAHVGDTIATTTDPGWTPDEE